MESGEIRFSCGEDLGTKTLGTQSGLRFRQLHRVGIESEDMPTWSHAPKKPAGVSPEAQCAIDSHLTGARVKDLQNLVHHDWHMAAGRRLA